jgi:hypothetical protein
MVKRAEHVAITNRHAVVFICHIHTQKLVQVICASHFEKILTSVISSPKEIVDIACVSKFIHKIQQL